MGNYYFLAASLPDLALGHKPELSFEEMKSRVKINLNKEDQESVSLLTRFIDIQNIRALLLKEPLDTKGTLSEKELEEALLVQDAFPQYVFDVLDRFETVEEQVRNFSGVISRFFAEEVGSHQGFMRKYLIFEREWRLVLTALRAKATKRDITRELQFEDPTDPFIAEILAQKDGEYYEPPEEFLELKELVASHQGDPWAEHRAFSEWRLIKIEELVEAPLFSIDWILSYLARQLIIEQDNELNKTQGKKIIEQLTQG